MSNNSIASHDLSAFIKFPLGHLVSTPGALDFLQINKQEPSTFIERHMRGDWGDICAEDKQTNELALTEGGRLMSVYKISGEPGGQGGRDTALWIITEWDRSVTTLLLPSEY